MYLEKIELHGFKSFANRTTIHFPKPASKKHHGITAIVGPNGSGKSNIIDALRWVLGEQSTKTLRGKKGQDVIFSGSKTKGRMGMAEVTLFFNNEDKRADVEYSEIIITRRLYRDGESEYRLNNNKVRLQDIVMLLAQCHVGQKSYSIIGQGMITEIINSTPTERKQFFDEATGIKQYQIRRDQAANKLKRTRENLDQSSQIVEELTPRLRLLKRQVNKLEQRKIIEKDLREHQGKYYSALWQNLESLKQKAVDESKVFEEKKRELDKKIAEIHSELSKLSDSDSRQEVYTKLQNDYNELIFTKNKLTQELATIKGKTNVEYSKLGKQNLSWLELKEDEIQHKREASRQELEGLTQEINKLTSSLSQKNETLTKLNSEFERIETALIQAQRDDNNNFVYKKPHIKALLQNKSQFPGIISTANELGFVEEEYARALEVAAGRYTEAIVTENENTARDCIQFLRQNRLGTATFLPLTKIRGRHISDSTRNLIDVPGVFGLAVDLIDFDDKYYDVFSFIFGSTLIIDHIETAKKIGIGNERMITLEGDLLEKTGVIRGGFRRYRSEFTFSSQQRTHSSTEKIDELEARRLEILQQKRTLESEVNQIRIDIEIRKSKQQLLTNTISSLEQEAQKIKQEIQEQEVSPEQRDEMLQKYLVRKEEVRNEIEKLDETLSRQRSKIDEFNQEEEKKKQKLFALQHELQELQLQLNDINKSLNEYQIQITRIDTKKEDLTNELLEEIGDNFHSMLSSEPQEINVEAIYNHIRSLKQKLSVIGGIDPEVIDEYNEVQERYDFLSTQISDLEKALTDTQKIIKELDVIIKKQFESSFKKINKAFDHFFKKLFVGGKAKLELIHQESVTKTIIDDQGNEIELPDDTDDEGATTKKQKITTGIDIMASPGNKKITNMTMMSGGEKTMTSIALIAAIISNNSSPFVFLDEVDAALDEANSQRLADILQELCEITQFIVITHNRVVMHAADILYGVAMGQDGITQLLSLNITEAEQMAE